MSVSYLVRYRGNAEDTAAFLDHYRTRHAPILWEFPRLRSLILHHGVDARDPCPVISDGSLLLAQMVFDSVDDLNLALASPARLRAREDFARMPAFSGAVTHQAAMAEMIRK